MFTRHVSRQADNYLTRRPKDSAQDPEAAALRITGVTDWMFASIPAGRSWFGSLMHDLDYFQATNFGEIADIDDEQSPNRSTKYYGSSVPPEWAEIDFGALYLSDGTPLSSPIEHFDTLPPELKARFQKGVTDDVWSQNRGKLAANANIYENPDDPTQIFVSLDSANNYPGLGQLVTSAGGGVQLFTDKEGKQPLTISRASVEQIANERDSDASDATRLANQLMPFDPSHNASVIKDVTYTKAPTFGKMYYKVGASIDPLHRLLREQSF